MSDVAPYICIFGFGSLHALINCISERISFLMSKH